MARGMYVSVSDIMRDPDQTTVYNLRTDKRYVVEGCAGSGKSSLALLLMQKILAERGEDDNVPTPIYYATTAHELVECVRQQFRYFDTPPRYNDYAITGGENGMWGCKRITDLQRKDQNPRGPYVINSRTCMLQRYDSGGRFKTFVNEDIRINPTPDYLLIDEAQDFNRDSIDDFLRSAKNGCVFYGDDTQSIMDFTNPMLLRDIEILLQTKYGRTTATGNVIIYRYILKRNWRLSREIAAFAQELPNGVSDPMLLQRCRGEYHEKPILAQMPPGTQTETMNSMVSYIKQRITRATMDDDVGIIMRTNEEVKSFYNALRGMGNVSARFNILSRQLFKTPEEARDFVERTNKRQGFKARQDPTNPREVEVGEYEYLKNTPVKIMTYENAKGQQFRDVYLIGTDRLLRDTQGLNRFYVGVTRAERFLRIMYSGQLPAFLQNVDPDLYVTHD